MRRVGLSAFIVTLLAGCANQTSPTGGPKDEIPPRFISSTPSPNQKNFKGKKIELLFSEDVQLREAKEQIIITPSPSKEITYTAKKNKVIIEPDTNWKDSTTYSIIFRESVRDMTEANPALNLKLAFSTGPTIDSLSMSGAVREALTEKIPENITVALYQQDTFDIFKHTPSYFTKSNKLGKFKIENLKQGSYYIYAFDDKNKNLKVESTSEKYGFIGKAVNLTANKDSLNISLVALDARPIKLNSTRGNIQVTTARFNKALVNYKVELNKPHPTSYSYGSNQAEVLFYHHSPIQKNDSLPVRVTATDSLDQTYDSLIYIKSSENKYVKDKFLFSLAAPLIDMETNVLTVEGKANKIIKKFTTDSLQIKVDTIAVIAFSEPEIENDTINKRFRIIKKIDRKVIPAKINSLTIEYKRSFLISAEGDSSKATKADITLYAPEDVGTLLVEVKTAATNYEVELLGSDGKPLKSFRNKTKFTFKNLPPQEYKIRAYVDTNNNGKWDAGNIYKKEEPEPTYFYQTPEKKFSFPIRANWELGPLVLSF